MSGGVKKTVGSIVLELMNEPGILDDLIVSAQEKGAKKRISSRKRSDAAAKRQREAPRWREDSLMLDYIQWPLNNNATTTDTSMGPTLETGRTRCSICKSPTCPCPSREVY